MTPLIKDLFGNLTRALDYLAAPRIFELFLTKQALDELNDELQISYGNFTEGETFEMDGYKFIITLTDAS